MMLLTLGVEVVPSLDPILSHLEPCCKLGPIGAGCSPQGVREDSRGLMEFGWPLEIWGTRAFGGDVL